MKKFLIVLIAFVIAFSAIGLTACKNKEELKNENGKYSQFGEFSYKGKTLIDYAVKTISASEAKQILAAGRAEKNNVAVGLNANVALVASADNAPTADIVNDILKNYAGCDITTKYYVDNKDDLQIKIDKLTGVDFKHVLEENRFTPFSQLVAKNVIVYDGLIDYMEEANAEFAASERGLVAPFKSVFSYHEDANGNLIIQIRDYAEIASSVGGGIGASYRQDTEIIYDSEGKMITWQTSLGLYSSTPQGTIKEGYILEMSVDWIEKV